MLQWSDLLAALALFLVLEGLLPFASPGAMKRALARLVEIPERELRFAGLGSVIAGLALLYFVRS